MDDTVPHNRWYMLLSTAMLGWLQARNWYLFLQLLPMYSHYRTHKRKECLWESRFVNFSLVVAHDTGISFYEQTDTERITFFPRLLHTKYLPVGGFVHIARAITLYGGGHCWNEQLTVSVGDIVTSHSRMWREQVLSKQRWQSTYEHGVIFQKA